MTWIRENGMQISQFFVNGDIKGAIAYMRDHEEFKDILPAYVAIFEDQKYRTYEIPDDLNNILRLYQIYFRDTFYCGSPEAEAADKLRTGLKALLNTPDAGKGLLTEQVQSLFEAEGYHALFGKTQGYYGPYIWRDTVPTVYRVELPSGTAEYTVNIFKGFVFRSWMDYLTFGRYGTGGWASPDGTINCIEQAYDFASTFSSANNYGASKSEASCWRLRRQRTESAAANMPLWTLFLFKRPHFTKTMDTGRFLRSKNIRTSANGTITQKNYFNFKFYGGKNMKYTVH